MDLGTFSGAQKISWTSLRTQNSHVTERQPDRHDSCLRNRLFPQVSNTTMAGCSTRESECLSGQKKISPWPEAAAHRPHLTAVLPSEISTNLSKVKHVPTDNAETSPSLQAPGRFCGSHLKTERSKPSGARKALEMIRGDLRQLKQRLMASSGAIDSASGAIGSDRDLESYLRRDGQYSSARGEESKNRVMLYYMARLC